jgi:hypothetical protein
MKKLTRILTMSGFGLLAALAGGAGPAQASAPEGKTVGAHHVQWRAGDDVVGYYRTLRDCEIAGRFGERTGHWDDHNCSPVRVGVRRGAWALQVASNDDWHRHGFGVPFRATSGFPTQFRPVWAGAFNPGPGNNHAGPGMNHPGPGINHSGPGNDEPRPDMNHSGPNNNHSGPSNGHSGPSDHSGPGNTQTGPGNTQTGPGNTQTGPGNTQTGPGNTQTGPGNTQTGPGHSSPGNTQNGPHPTTTNPTSGPTRGMGH